MAAFENLGLSEALILFVICALAVWRAGSGLAYVADALSDRFRWEKSLVGLIALSTATSLPEIATTLSAAASQARELVLNNLFGGGQYLASPKIRSVWRLGSRRSAGSR